LDSCFKLRGIKPEIKRESYTYEVMTHKLQLVGLSYAVRSLDQSTQLPA
jgi:hypothetical protein